MRLVRIFQIVPPPVSPISCEINADVVKNVGLSTENVRKVNCLISGDGKKNNEVFLPFSFIKSYFDVRRNFFASYRSYVLSNQCPSPKKIILLFVRW